jgi:hypothetical protein
MSIGRLVRNTTAAALGAGGAVLFGAGFNAASKASQSNSGNMMPALMLGGGLGAMIIGGAIGGACRSEQPAPAPDIEMGVVTGPEARRAVLTEAMNIAMNMGDVDMSEQIGPHGQRIVDHLHDLHLNAAEPVVRRAVDRANNAPQAIVTNLLGLINQGIVSHRLTSTLPTAT